ncbi:MAG: glycosyltransferase family 2 protein [Bauldia sp.]|uniref:glycosyltransferase family 2 protein n=1 Tax=Bauldia sp. TaxID=2575872 RepID=UPI001D69BCA2|nr:glycosyltransferase family 2 protein [Bauldia sp.]MCB1498084.1 glycosyltransferase family 2 protein [Bauldia sp.]
MAGNDAGRSPRGKRPLISITIPVLNESDNMDRLYQRLVAVGDKLADRCDIEIVFSDNCSEDDTWQKIEALSKRDDRVRGIRFAKGVGFQRSILANFLHTRGDAIMQLDADLQDPPEMLEAFMDRWEEGFDVVYGIRRSRPEPALLRGFRNVGYTVIGMISEHPIPRQAGDFRLIDRKVLNALVKFRTPNPYLRGMIAGLGFRQMGIEYDRDARVAGKSKFGVNRLLRLGLTAVFNHSSVPLRLATVVGLAAMAASVLGTIYYVVLRLVRPDLPPGLASIHILVLFGIGLQSVLLGIIGEYILRIYVMLRGDPVAIIDQSVNFSDDELKL